MNNNNMDEQREILIRLQEQIAENKKNGTTNTVPNIAKEIESLKIKKDSPKKEGATKKKKKEPNRTKPKQLAFRLTEEEYKELMEKVTASGMTQQQFLTTAIMNTTIVNTDGLKEFRTDLKRIGNNLNQIARSCNEGNPVTQSTKAAVEQIGKELNEVWQQLRQYTAEQVQVKR